MCIRDSLHHIAYPCLSGFAALFSFVLSTSSLACLSVCAACVRRAVYSLVPVSSVAASASLSAYLLVSPAGRASPCSTGPRTPCEGARPRGGGWGRKR
eukprot:2092020-Alexandrium_andersonii.AAC.1